MTPVGSLSSHARGEAHVDDGMVDAEAAEILVEAARDEEHTA